MKIVINNLLVREVYRGVGIKKDGYENIEVRILTTHKGLELDYGGKVYSLINGKVIQHKE